MVALLARDIEKAKEPIPAMVAEVAAAAGCEVGDKRVSPWRELWDADSRSSYLLEKRMLQLLHDADESDRPWRAAACREAAMALWRVLQERGHSYRLLKDLDR